MSKVQFGEYYLEYLLGSLEASERQHLQEHSQVCPECRQDLADLQETLHSLPMALPEKMPPAELKQKILREIGAGAASFTSFTWWRTWAIAASILVVALGAISVSFYRQVQNKNSAIASLLREREQLRESNQDLFNKINQLTRPRLRYLNLAGLTGYEKVSGSAFINPDANSARVFFHNLPAVAENRAFQLWVIEPGQNPRPSNVFSSRGPVTEVEVGLSVKAEKVLALAVTIEPPEGSPQPTGPMVVLGKF